MAPANRISKKKNFINRAYGNGVQTWRQARPIAFSLTNQQITSHTEPQFLEISMRQWAHRQSLANEYDVHKRNTRVDPIAQQAVSGMSISRFVQPVTPTLNHINNSPPLFHTGSLPEDLSYSLRNFVVVDPVQNANVVYTRIAIKEGRTMAGYVPALPQPRRVVKSKGDFVDSAADDLEVLEDQ